MNDAAFILKELLRVTPDISQRLDHLTSVGLFTDDRRLFEFTERLRGLLVKRDEMAKRAGANVPRRKQSQDSRKLSQKEASNGLHEAQDSVETI